MTVLTCTGCASNSISDSLTLIKREANLASNTENKRVVNKSVLTSIQALRTSKTSIKKNVFQSFTFTYELHNKELNYDDKIKIVSLVVDKDTNVTINIALAKGENRLNQLALSMARAEVLRLYINNFNNKVIIKFAPKLSTDTINLVTGA